MGRQDMQVSNELETLSESEGILRAVIRILVFGSIWELVEATPGRSSRVIHFTYKGVITGGFSTAVAFALGL
jgi:hypothetical protein